MKSWPITTVLTAAATINLTDLATVKEELGLGLDSTADDSFLTRAVAQASTAIANYCDRTFPVETVQDLFLGDGCSWPPQTPDPLQLTRWPLSTAGATLTTSAGTASGSTLHFSSTSGAVAGQPVTGDNVALGTVAGTVTANTSVALSAAVEGAVASGASIVFGLAVAVTDTDGTVTKLAAGTDFLVDAARGWLIRLDSDGVPTWWERAASIRVAYQAGFSDIPDDIEGVALRLITARYKARGRDPMLRTRDQGGTGSETYWVGGLPGVQGAFPQEIAAILDAYCEPAAG